VAREGVAFCPRTQVWSVPRNPPGECNVGTLAPSIEDLDVNVVPNSNPFLLIHGAFFLSRSLPY
jgi:hypothetical protein